jgi:hypothetical protein
MSEHAIRVFNAKYARIAEPLTRCQTKTDRTAIASIDFTKTQAHNTRARSP